MLLIVGTLTVGSILGAAPTYAEPAAATDAGLDRWQEFIAEASRRFGVSEAWIRAVMHAESGGRTMLYGRPITSGAGAMGLMQVMPDTYEEMRHAHGLGSDPYDPRDNILAGTGYLRAMYDRFGYPDLFAAYNAGPERYDEYLSHGRSLPAETRAFLATIAQIDPGSRPSPSVASGTRLFFTLQTTANAPSGRDGVAPSSDLFVPLTTVPDGQR
ncbi:lytic transglycosylase domain-containing protein [Tistrella bauzanensis]|uniref:lytic transglycosylase domain-containing protein n=1 Tax=Tistrella TaxID=171436 RepID=UPI0031FB18B8